MIKDLRSRIFQHAAAAVLTVALLGFAGDPVAAASHVFQLDTGGHQGDIRDVIFTADGKQIVSAGEDKVIRVWDWRSGRTVRTIRGQIEPGNSGKIFALALSPDERWLAAAGWMDASDAQEPCCGDIRLFDFATGKLVAVLQGHGNSVYDLAFSPDSTLLASGGADQRIILWDVKSHQIVRELDETQAHTDRVVRVQFVQGGRKLVSAGYDGHVKVWSTADGKLLSDVRQHKTRIYALAVNADGTKIASGDADGEIRLWQAATKASQVLAQQKVTIGALAFSNNATQLIATCGYRCPENPGEHIWDLASGKLARKYEGHDDTVRAVAVSPDGNWVATAGGRNNEIHVWGAGDGHLERSLKGHGAIVYSVGISKDRRRLAWGNENPCPSDPACPKILGNLQHELVLPSESQALEVQLSLTTPATDFQRAAIQIGGWTADVAPGGRFDRKDAILNISEGQKQRAAIERGAQNGFGHTAYSFLGAGATLVTGGDHGVLTLYQSRTKQLVRDFIGHTSVITAIAPSKDSKLLITGSADQTVRLWNAATGELVVSMLFTLDGEWVIWTEQGYYDSSAGGDRMVGWQINEGSDREARYVSARQLKEKLYSPGIIRKAITLGSAQRAIKQLRPAAPNLDTLLAVAPPVMEIRSPAYGATVNRESAKVVLDVDTGPNALTRVEVIVNGKNVTSGEHLRTESAPQFFFHVPLQKQENHILIVGYNDAGYTSERTLDITNLTSGSLDTLGRLYIIAVGVNNYPGMPPVCGEPQGSCDLSFSVVDAVKFQEAIIATVAPRYKGASSLLLVNQAESWLTTGQAGNEAKSASVIAKEPTSEAIGEQLTTFLAQTTPQDLVILFLAGHGISIGEKYYFAPTNAVLNSDGTYVMDKLVSWKTLQAAIQGARGTRLLFLDTCHSGNAYNASLEKDASDARIIAYSATKANSVSVELAELGHGAFTYSLIKGLTGEADYNKDQTVEVLELGSFSSSEVKRVTKNFQSPVFYSSGVEDFVLAAP